MKQFFTTIKILTLLIMVAVGASYAFAQVDPGENEDARPEEVNPQARPASPSLPGAGIPIPIHTGFNQTKDGSLSVGIFGATENATFDGLPTSIFFKGAVRGERVLDPLYSPTAPTISKLLAYLSDGGLSEKKSFSQVTIGGYVGATQYRNSVVASGPIVTKGHFLANNIAGTGDWFMTNRAKTELCADIDGTVILCNEIVAPPGVDLCDNIQDIQTQLPDGMRFEGSNCVFTFDPANLSIESALLFNITGYYDAGGVWHQMYDDVYHGVFISSIELVDTEGNVRYTLSSATDSVLAALNEQGGNAGGAIDRIDGPLTLKVLFGFNYALYPHQVDRLMSQIGGVIDFSIQVIDSTGISTCYVIQNTGDKTWDANHKIQRQNKSLLNPPANTTGPYDAYLLTQKNFRIAPNDPNKDLEIGFYEKNQNAVNYNSCYKN